MEKHHRTGWISMLIIFFSFTILLPATAFAYSQYSQNGDATNCAGCHGDFRSNNYISPVDGQSWGNIHNLHRSTMLGGDCSTCHSPSGRFPVLLDQSTGGDGLDPIACMGCHGRAEDNVAGNPGFPHGRGAGLRQHHSNAGVTECAGCHDDANPANYTPVGEEVLPPYYANPGTSHPSMPTGSCNDDGSEHFAGATIGLDNDGDQIYDTADPGCDLSPVPGSYPTARLLQNHPNPFNPLTNIQYVVDEPGHVLLQVFSVKGNLVQTLVDARIDRAATYQVTWNGQGEDGRSLASGIYFYRLDSPHGVEMKKMLLLK